MKRYLSILFGCLFPLVVAASSRIAVLNLEAGVGLTSSQVNGLQSMLISALQNSGEFTIVERSRVDDLVREMGISNGKRPTKGQLSSFARRLGVEAVLVGTVNFQARDRYVSDVITGTQRGEYNVDIRLISTKSGRVLCSVGDIQKSNETTRNLMNRLAQNLVDGFESQTESSILTQPVLINGYLLVYPKDLGSFSTNPSRSVDMINRQASYGYTDWRLPTPEELSQMITERLSLGMKKNQIYATQNTIFNGGTVAVRLVRSKVIAQRSGRSDGTLQVTPKDIDLGRVPVLRGFADGYFKIINESNSIIEIISITSPSSNIEILSYEPSISPGSTTVIRFRLDVNGRQGMNIKRNIEIELSNGMKSSVTIKAYVE